MEAFALGEAGRLMADPPPPPPPHSPAFLPLAHPCCQLLSLPTGRVWDWAEPSRQAAQEMSHKNTNIFPSRTERFRQCCKKETKTTSNPTNHGDGLLKRENFLTQGSLWGEMVGGGGRSLLMQCAWTCSSFPFLPVPPGNRNFYLEWNLKMEKEKESKNNVRKNATPSLSEIFHFFPPRPPQIHFLHLLLKYLHSETASAQLCHFSYYVQIIA